MPSVSEAQHRAMEAAAHGNSTIGIPEKAGKEFVAADKKAKKMSAGGRVPFDLSQHKLIGETPEHWHIQGPAGSFKVAKKGLSKKLTESIVAHFADGGEVPNLTGDPSVDALIASGSIPAAAVSSQPVAPASLPIDVTLPPDATPDMVAAQKAGIAQLQTQAPRAPGSQYAVPTRSGVPIDVPLSMDPNVDLGKLLPAQGVTQPPASAPTQPAAYTPPMMASHAPSGSTPQIDPRQAAEVAAATAALSKPSGGGAPAVPGSSAQREIDSAYQKAAAAEQAKADVAKNEAQATLEAQQKGEADRQALVGQWQKTWSDWQARGDDLRQSILNQKIEPNRIFANASTGGKVSAAIGLILGGLGAGLTRGPNQALEVIQKAVDRDIDAQKAELGKKETLLGFHMQQGHQLQASYQLAKADMLDGIAARLQMTATKFAGQKAQAGASATIAALQKEAAITRQQVASVGLDNALKAYQLQMIPYQIATIRAGLAMLNGQGGAPTDGYLPSRAPPPAGSDPMSPVKYAVEARRDAGERTLMVNGTQPFLAYDKETAQKSRPMLQAIENVKAIVGKMRDLQANSLGIPGTDSANLYAKYRAALSEQWAMANGLTQPSETTNANLEKVMPSNWDAFARNKSRFEPITNLVRDREHGILLSAGLDPRVLAPKSFTPGG